MGYYDYAKNDIKKWRILIGFKVNHFNSLLGQGTIIDVYNVKEQIYLKLRFNKNQYDGAKEKIFSNRDIENFCDIENLDSIKTFFEYNKKNPNKNLSKIKKEKYLSNKTSHKVNCYLKVKMDECISDSRLLKDKIYKIEAGHLAYTLNVLSDQINNINKNIAKYDAESTYTYSPTPTEMLEMRQLRLERRVLYKKVEEVKGRYEKPYFSKMTIESDDNKIYTYYIGEKDIYNNKNIVHDWRSNLGQRYYRRNELVFKIGKKGFKTNLIRSINIENSILISYYDDYIGNEKNDFNKDKLVNKNDNNISDPFLIEILRKKRNITELTNIISTIQEKQNNIITQNINDNFIVQGCAGSGKTMILLHRLSFLIYNNNKIDLDKIKIITPNNLFKMTIGNLARELQIDQIEKLCIDEYMDKKILEYGFNIKGKIVSANIPEKLYEYIYSYEFIDLLKKSYENYCIELKKRFEDIGINILINIYKINGDSSGLKNINNLNYLARRVIEELSKKEKQYYEDVKEYKKIEKSIINDSKYKNMLETLIDLKDKRDKLRLFSFKRRKELNDNIGRILKECGLSNELSSRELIELLNERKGGLLKAENKKMELKNYKEKYFLNRDLSELKKEINDFIILTDDNITFLDDKIYRPLMEKISKEYKYTGYNLKSRVKIFSLLTLLYIHKGPLDKTEKMIYFDEGQDINYFEYKIINDINNNFSIFNIFGDINQLTSSQRGIVNWNKLFNMKKIKIFYLNENYRNPKAITKYCINKTGYNMDSIGVDEGNVFDTQCNNKRVTDIITLFNKDCSVRKVIIVKEINEEIKSFIYNYFKEEDINIIYENIDFISLNKINIMNVQSSKGMEFDSTLIITKNMNRNELYIALSRALINSYIINT